MATLTDKKVAVLAADGFEQSELEQPVQALKDAGATVEIVSPKSGAIKGWKDKDWGSEVSVDKILDEVSANDYHALVLPGGLMNPDTLRTEPKAVAFAKAFMDDKKPVAAICHGPWLLAEADAVRGRKMTSYKSIQTDLKNAGAEWVDAEVVTDNGFVTSRNPNDLPAFCKKMIEEIAEGKHDR